MTDPYLEPSRPSARPMNDVGHRRAAATVRPVQRSVETAPAYQQRSEQSLQPTLSHELASLKDHLLRMIETAGHSWATYEHDVLMSPLQRFSKKSFGLLPARIRHSKLLPGRSHSWHAAYFMVLFVSLLAIPAGMIIRSDLRAQRYVLSAATKQLVGAPVVTLDKQFKYDAKSATYQYNPAAANGIKSMPDASGDNGLTVGGSKYYGVDVAAQANKGQTYTDAQTKLSFTLVPQFGALDGKHIDGHVVYPIDGGQAVYTLKSNGLKEDVVLSSPTDSATLKYKLSLPADLQAKLMPNGSVGIYSADPSLFGNISFGSDKDQTAVQKARTNGTKNNLVFQIPAPIITESGTAKGTGKAVFKLSGDQLTVSATNLQKLSYPISIDPSVVVQSANSFSNGNDEDGNSLITGTSVTRSALTGGTLGAWASANTGANIPLRENVTVIAYNGYLYAIGGQNAATGYSDVYYALIQTGGQAGKLGAWTLNPNSILGSSRTSTNLVVYNGYMYMIAGNNSGNTSFDDAQYALVCTGNNSGVGGCSAATGSLGTWLYGNGTATQQGTAGGSFGAAGTSVDGSRLIQRTTASATVAYNNKIYVMGGCVYLPISCNKATDDVQVATIQANGTLSTWTIQSTLPTKRNGEGGVVFNGRIYLTGGCTVINNIANSCTTSAGDTIFTPINSDGTLGSWTTATYSFSGGAPTVGVNTYVNKGYLYMLNGAGGTPVAYAQYAPIYANGQLGPWQTTNIPTAASNAGYTVYNGYAYQVDGCIQSSTNCNTYTASVFYAPVDTPGTITPYTATADFDTASNERANITAVAMGGYMYLFGGKSLSDNTVRFGTIGADGTIGAWATATNNFTDGRSCAGAVGYAGSIYMAGGCIGGGAARGNCNSGSVNNWYCVDVQRATVNASTGQLTWTNTYTYSSTGRSFPAVSVINGYLYIVGGTFNNNSSVSAEVDFAQINADGTLGTFGPTTQPLSTARGEGVGAVSWGGRIYVVGGRGSPSTEYATPTATGDITSWGTTGTNLDQTYIGAAVVGYNGYIYITGGVYGVGTYVNTTRYARINTDGTMNAWVTSNQTFTTGRNDHASTAYNGYLYIMGGCNTALCASGNIFKDTQFTRINNGGGGSSGTWNTTTNMPYSTGAGESIAYNGYLYVMGGCTGVACLGGGTFASVYHTTLNADGTIGASWTPDTPMTFSRAAFGLVAYGGKIYVLGGYGAINGGGGGSGNQNDVYYATPNASTGNITSWTLNPAAFSVARQYLSAFAYNGYMYIAGGSQAGTTGCNTVANSVCSDVQFAPILSTGALGPWHFTHNSTDDNTTFVSGFATGRQLAVGLINNGYAYIIGGQDGTNYINDVQYAKLNNDGTLGSWAATTSLTYPRGTFIGTAYNGYLYAYNGVTTGSAAMANVEYAPFTSNGSLGRWTVAPTPITTNAATYSYGSGAIANGYIYYMGGQSGISLGNTVSYSPLQVIPRIAHYSRLIDLASTVNGNVGGDPQITRYNFAGTSPATASGPSGFNFCTSNATNSTATFGTATCTVGGVTLGTATAAKGFGRYGFVFVTLDDSQSATFPDASQSTISEMDVYFHASPARRLRGGQTFTNSTSGTSVTNQLDTEGP